MSYELEFPIFIPFERDVFTLGTPNQEEARVFTSLESLRYISGFVKEISYHDKNLRAGLMRKFFAFDNTFIWGNPFFDKSTPQFGSHIYFETKSICFYTSSVQNPSLMFLKGDGKPFERFTEKLWLKELRLKPIIYADWQLTSDLKETWGVGIDLKMTYWKKEEHSLGFEGGFSYANEMLRSTLLSSYQFSSMEMGLGGILQDDTHPKSPILSPLYPAFREEISTTPLGRSSYTAGGSFLFRWQKPETDEYGHSFNFYLDIYPKRVFEFSYRLSYQIRAEAFLVDISYLRDRISELRDVANLKANTSFLGFEFRTTIIDDLFEIGWSSYLGWDQKALVRSKLYAHLLI